MGNFTTPCFIRVNIPELREKLEELGYDHDVLSYVKEGDCLITNSDIYYECDNDMEARFDCDTNEALFLALAALSDDSDKGQWFISPFNYWRKCGCDRFYIDCQLCEEKRIIHNLWHKATPTELIEHFSHDKQ